MSELKRLSAEGVPAALEKAERYRLLNEPWAAESICRDALEVAPDNARALVMLVLALTDQFGQSGAPSTQEVLRLVRRLDDPYQRAYYTGIMSERQAKALIARGGMGSGSVAYEFLQDAMAAYAEAERLRPPGDDSALLRWNTCVRILERHPNLGPAHVDRTPLTLE